MQDNSISPNRDPNSSPIQSPASDEDQPTVPSENQGEDPDRPSAYETDWQYDSLLHFVRSITAQIRRDDDDNAKVLLELLESFAAAAHAYLLTGINLIDPAQSPNFNGGHLRNPDDRIGDRRTMLQRIHNEWMQLVTIISTARMLDEQPPIPQLRRFITIALNDLNWTEAEQQKSLKFVVLPYFGRRFELLSFAYAPTIFVLGIPATEIHCPWNWSLIWHEIAGVYIAQQRRNAKATAAASQGNAQPLESVIDQVRKEVERFAKDKGWKPWATANQVSLQGLLDKAGRLQRKLRSSVPQNWAEELVEDGISILCFGKSMVATLQGVLRVAYEPMRAEIDQNGQAKIRVAPPDFRHPPVSLRVEVARSLAKLILEEQPDNSQASSIAKIIFNRRSDLVRRVFNQDDQRRVDEIVTGIRNRSTPPLDWAKTDEASDRDCRSHLAAIGGAMRSPDESSYPVRGEDIRKLMYAFTNETVLPQSIDKIDIPKFTSLAQLLNYSLSTSDPAFSITEVQEGAISYYVNVTISGLSGPQGYKYHGSRDIYLARE